MRIIAFLLIFTSACTTSLPKQSIRHGNLKALSAVVEADLTEFFGDIDGTFVLLTVDADAHTSTDSMAICHNCKRAHTRFLPASTFKIPHTLIALETGVASGADFHLERSPASAPSAEWWPESWYESHTLKTALPNSVVWYYQEIARRIGRERMQAYVSDFRYGNEDIGGGIDQFWLNGNLTVSAVEQVEFLHRLYYEKLSVSPLSTNVMKELLVLEEGSDWKFSGKTGWAVPTTPGQAEIGWFVGYVEQLDRVSFFALNIEVRKTSDLAARQRIVKAVLHSYGLMK